MESRFIALLFFLNAMLQSTAVTLEENKTKIECFKTVQHYTSNPRVTGESKEYLTYANDDYKTITVNLDCSDFVNQTGAIVVREVNLLLPANNNEDYCLKNVTKNSACTSNSQCSCCKVPTKVCRAKAQHKKIDCRSTCNCKVTVTSEFLEHCTGRVYSCDNQNCHSRWAELKYTLDPSASASTMWILTGWLIGGASAVMVGMVAVYYNSVD